MTANSPWLPKDHWRHYDNHQGGLTRHSNNYPITETLSKSLTEELQSL